MKKVQRIITVSLISTLLAIPFAAVSSRPAQAANAERWRAGKIIDDSLFMSVTMSVGDIQAFLNNQVPVCDTWGTRPASEYGRGDITHAQYAALRGWPAPPYVCLKDYHEVPKTEPGNWLPTNSYDNGGNPPAGSISAAQMIYNAAARYNINPRVLLVKLDTESAGPLTRDTWPLRKQYTYAMGAHVPDSGPGGSANPDVNYAGFSLQIDEAARLLRYYITNMQQSWWDNKRPFQVNNILWNVAPSGCGGGNVFLENKSTTALYVYTPYQPNQAALNNLYGSGDGCSAYGNRNFWRVWTDWFGDPSSSPLVRTPSAPTYYLLSNGKRFAIANGDMLYAYGLERTPLQVVSDAYLASIPDGGMLQTLFKVPGDGTIYLADGGRHLGIASGEYCVRWGLPCDNPAAISEVGSEILGQLGEGGVLQAIMGFQNKRYLMENGKKRWIVSDKALFDNGYSYALSPIVNWTNATRDYGFSILEDDSFVKIESTQTIYAYSKDKFYSLPDYPTFLNWQSSQTPGYADTVSSYNSQPPTPSGTLGSVVNANGEKYLLDRGRRITITSAAAEWAPGMDATGLTVMLNRLPAISYEANTPLKEPEGGIVLVTGQRKHYFNSMRDYNDLGYGSKYIQLNGSLNLPAGSPLLAPTTAYKQKGSDTIFMMGMNNVSYPLFSMQQFGAFAVNPIGRTLSADEYAPFTPATYTPTVVTNGSQIYAISPSGKTLLQDSDIARWGFDKSKIVQLNDASIARISTTNKTPLFFGAPDGTIYQGLDGQKHPIASFDAYRRLGGNDTNTQLVFQPMLDAMPTGSALH